MKVSDRAEVSRSFNVKDLEEYSALSGHVVNTEYVPEPLIGALFSYLLGVKVPGDGTMYLKQETRYLDEARLGETLHASAEITRLRPEKSLVDLESTAFKVVKALREKWLSAEPGEDNYRKPGPVRFAGRSEEDRPFTLTLNAIGAQRAKKR